MVSRLAGLCGSTTHKREKACFAFLSVLHPEASPLRKTRPPAEETLRAPPARGAPGFGGTERGTAGPEQDAGSWQEDPGATPSTPPHTPLRGGGGVTPISTNDVGVLDHVIHKCHATLHDTYYRRGWGPDVIGSQGTRLCSHGKAFFSTSGPGAATLLRGMEWAGLFPTGPNCPRMGGEEPGEAQVWGIIQPRGWKGADAWAGGRVCWAPLMGYTLQQPHLSPAHETA